MKDRMKRIVEVVDRWQRGNRVAGPGYGVVKKFGDDNANTLVVALAWYGFTAIYPLLLVVVTVFGFIGAASLGGTIVHELHQFPVIGDQFNPGHGSQQLHGSAFGLVVGCVGLIYGSLGVTQTAQMVMGRVWNVPQAKLPGFLPRLARSLAGLLVIAGAFLVTAAASGLAAGSGRSWAVRIPVILALVVVNSLFYLASFRILTPSDADTGSLLPGAIAGGVFFTFLTTLGTALVQHQLKNTSATYGALASVIGVVAYLLLLSKFSIYAAELNPVLRRKLWPRALPLCEPSEADEQVLRALAHEQQRRDDERVGVGFGPDSAQEAAQDARLAGGDQGAGGDDAQAGQASAERGSPGRGGQPATGAPEGSGADSVDARTRR